MQGREWARQGEMLTPSGPQGNETSGRTGRVPCLFSPSLWNTSIGWMVVTSPALDPPVLVFLPKRVVGFSKLRAQYEIPAPTGMTTPDTYNSHWP